MMNCPACGSQPSGAMGVRCASCDAPVRPCVIDGCRNVVPAEARYCGLCGGEQPAFESSVVSTFITPHPKAWRLTEKPFQSLQIPAVAQQALMQGVLWSSAGRLCCLLPGARAFASLTPTGGKLNVKLWPVPGHPDEHSLQPDGPLKLEHFLLFPGTETLAAWSISNFGREDASRYRSGILSLGGRLCAPPIVLDGNHFIVAIKEDARLVLREYEAHEPSPSGGHIDLLFKACREVTIPCDADALETRFQLVKVPVGRSSLAVVICGFSVFAIAEDGNGLQCKSIGELEVSGLQNSPMSPFLFAGESLFFRSKTAHGMAVICAHRWGTGNWQCKLVPNTQMAAQLAHSCDEEREFVVIRAAAGISRLDAWNTDVAQLKALQEPASMHELGPLAVVLLRTTGTAGSVALVDSRVTSDAWCFHSAGFTAVARCALLVADQILIPATRSGEVLVGCLTLSD